MAMSKNVPSGSAKSVTVSRSSRPSMSGQWWRPGWCRRARAPRRAGPGTMKQALWSGFALLLMTGPAAAADNRIRNLTGDFATQGVERVALQLALGTIRIEPSPDGRLRVEQGAYCAFDDLGCEERAEV